MVAGVLAQAKLVETLHATSSTQTSSLILSSRGRGQARVPAPLLDRHLEDRPSAAVGNLELQAIEAGGLHRQLAIRPQSLLENRLKVGQIDTLLILVQVVPVANVEKIERHGL